MKFASIHRDLWRWNCADGCWMVLRCLVNDQTRFSWTLSATSLTDASFPVKLGTRSELPDLITRWKSNVSGGRRTIVSFLLLLALTLSVFWATLGGGGLGTTYDVHLVLFGKRVLDFILAIIELFFARCYGWGPSEIDRKSAISLQCGHFDPKFQVEEVARQQLFLHS